MSLPKKGPAGHLPCAHARPPTRPSPARKPPLILQPLPPIGDAWRTKPLTEVEDTVLALVTLDSRLVGSRRREVLFLLAGIVHADAEPRKVGRALLRLREYHAARQVGSEAFTPRPAGSARFANPDPATAWTVMTALLARYRGQGHASTEVVRSALRLMGIV